MSSTMQEVWDWSTVHDDAGDRAWGLLVAVGVPIVFGALLVSVRSHMSPSQGALAMVIPVVVAAAWGGRSAGAVAALFSAASFDFFLTRPYLTLNMESRRDMWTAALLAVVGLIVGTVGTTNRRSRASSSAYADEIHSIHRVAELAATGRCGQIVEVAQTELTRILRLRECRYETVPFTGDLPELGRHGNAGGKLPTYVARRNGLELPAGGVSLPILADGRTVARFVLVATPGIGVTVHGRLAAVIIADQVGASLIATGA